MAMIKLAPACTDYLWGGRRLRTEYGVKSELDPLAEAWVLSCHPAAASVVASGADAGLGLPAWLEQQKNLGQNPLGTGSEAFAEFPILVKLIDAKQALSIQVHPSDAYALAHENQYGKTEMWYILDAAEDAFLYYGFQTEISKEEFAKRIEDETLLEVLNAVPVKKGDVFFIEPGTLHAIGAGIVIAEIQQNSNVTYRVYDFGRRDAAGNLRELHTAKAQDVTTLAPPKTQWDFGGHMVRCPYFTVDELQAPFAAVCDAQSFVSLLILEGSGNITLANETLPLAKGDSIFISANSGGYQLEGDCKLLCTQVGTK